jgi:hypothetical protein
MFEIPMSIGTTAYFLKKITYSSGYFPDRCYAEIIDAYLIRLILSAGCAASSETLKKYNQILWPQ